MHYRRFLTFQSPDTERNTLTLTEDEHYHLKTVLRGHKGYRMHVIDGKGGLYECEVEEIRASVTTAKIISHTYEEYNGPEIVMGVSVLKKKQMQLMIEKLSELGVSVIQPLIYERTDTSYSPSALEKWQKIALQSLKVNRRLHACKVRAPVKYEDFLNDIPADAVVTVLDIDGEPDALEKIGSFPVYAVTGPPGDYTPAEKELIKDKSFISLNINSGILRTETAAIAMASILTCRTGNEAMKRSEK